MVKVSLRSFHDHVDVSEVAKSFGGGGHKKAAGFTLPGDSHVDDLFDLPDEPTEEEVPVAIENKDIAVVSFEDSILPGEVEKDEA